MKGLEKMREIIDSLEMVPGHPNMRKKTGLRFLLEFMLANFVSKDNILEVLRDELRRNPAALRKAIGDTRCIPTVCVNPIVVNKPANIPEDMISGTAWAPAMRPDGFSTSVDVTGHFEWIGNPIFSSSDLIPAIFLPDDGIRYAPDIVWIPYIIEDEENLNPG